MSTPLWWAEVSEATPVAVTPEQNVRPGICLHCDLPVPTRMQGLFCCHGCEAVYALLHDDDELERYYSMRRGPGAPISDRPDPSRDLDWLIDAYQEDSSDEQKHLRLDIQGIHCSGCVWVLEKTFHRHTGALKLITNPALGTVELWITPEFPLREWLRAVERFGYRFGPPLKTSDRKTDTLLLRVGVTIAIALNVMILSVALYLGLNDGVLYRVFRSLSYGLASLSVVIGAPVFFRSAIAGLRNRVLHLDVPISVGIALAFAGSSWAFWSGRDSALYLDSVSVFIALMLLGRYLQERVLNANRNRLLASEGTEGLRSKRIDESGPVAIRSSEILSGDELLIAPGDLIPVAAELSAPEALVSTDWITGESRATQHRKGDPLVAGSFNAGKQSFRVVAETNFESSPLQSLLRPSDQSSSAAHETGLLRAISSYYVTAVLLAAAGGFLVWWLWSGAVQGLEVATAVLVVSCPCAFGIATPLAHELVQAQLRKSGLYIRNGDFLHRLANVRALVFDKTGTLTSGQVTLENTDVLNALDDKKKQILFTLATNSNHPASAAICQAFADLGDAPALLASLCVTELPGKGLECRVGGHLYRLGKASWAAGKGEGTAFASDGNLLAVLNAQEQARSDAESEMRALKEEGYQLYLLSGDAPDRVAQFANELGLPPEHALGAQTPEDKQRWLVEHDQGDMLFVGDGINDSLAAGAASCSGTPALDRPFMASNCDFYLGTNRIGPIREALHGARQLTHVVKRNIVFALAYNSVAISLAWAGLMRPWLAAILMPSSSIFVVVATSLSLSPRGGRWKS